MAYVVLNGRSEDLRSFITEESDLFLELLENIEDSYLHLMYHRSRDCKKLIKVRIINGNISYRDITNLLDYIGNSKDWFSIVITDSPSVSTEGSKVRVRIPNPKFSVVNGVRIYTPESPPIRRGSPYLIFD